ncbi:T9SS type A sorting domain-containing protein [Hymenobacter sp. ASUV-10]|uniref:T9SS type A sorting domain-containing protein n=1 Tax=Hymenobacter aranciens TaxID=3063996 RepID=A0ABT9BBL6_9BACT|nr:T9SS type A sorting domain-containing protein [Hymenobacter sp. ASUV-10]MDO7875660.1 T9SS type A sorting domain-containing protein [Hymenobacter sp. ASUV-10]
MTSTSTRFSWLTGLLLGLTTSLAVAQAPVSYFVSSAAPSADNNPSVLRRLQPNGQLATVGTVTNEDGQGVVMNALGYDSADPYHVYGMEVNDNGTVTPPTFYKVSMINASAVAMGTLTPPPTPRTSFPNLGLSFILPQLGDGAPGSRYYLGGATVRYNLFTGAVSDVKFYVGLINLTVAPGTIPAWKQVTMVDAATSTLLTSYISHVASVIADGGPMPTDGIQDWVLDPASGNLISYLGQEQRFFRLSNLNTTTPTAAISTPATPLPTTSSIGYLYRDGSNNVYAMSNATGTMYQLDRLTGSYLRTVAETGLGATQGDAATGPGVPTALPVTLTSFEAKAQTRSVQLSWATATEADVDHFEVQRRSDARTEWQTVGTLPAANFAKGNQYQLTDKAPLAGTSYYRLATIDRDGTVAYSAVRSLTYTGSAAATLTAEAYPNPSTGTFTLALSSPAPAGSTAALRDHLGRTVWQADLSNQQQLAVTLPSLPTGVYLLSTTAAGHTSTQRLSVVGQ